MSSRSSRSSMFGGATVFSRHASRFESLRPNLSRMAEPAERHCIFRPHLLRFVIGSQRERLSTPPRSHCHRHSLTSSLRLRLHAAKPRSCHSVSLHGAVQTPCAQARNLKSCDTAFPEWDKCAYSSPRRAQKSLPHQNFASPPSQLHGVWSAIPPPESHRRPLARTTCHPKTPPSAACRSAGNRIASAIRKIVREAAPGSTRHSAHCLDHPP